MRKPATAAGLDDPGRGLSRHFHFRAFPYSGIAGLHGIPNIADDPDLAMAAGRGPCGNLPEPLQAATTG